MTPIPSFIYKKSNQVAMVIFVPIFALLFISIYSPFDFNQIDTQGRVLSWLNIQSRELVVQLITLGLILIGMAVAAVSRWIMGVYTRKHQISYVTYITWIAIELLVMVMLYTFAGFSIESDKSFVTIFRNSLVKTFLILLIPYTMCYIYFIWQERVAQLRSIRERLAEDETTLKAAYVQIYDDKGEMRLSVRRENLILLESADNYVCVWYLNNNSPKKILVRNTLKNIADSLSSTHIQRCHRSYVVNLELVKVMRREKEGVFVELGIDGVPEVPISKTYAGAINKWLVDNA
ncbi:MAG: LytTR family transcriptional regulator [Alistipes sp.]|nr:LytTR family transcriptional regulator [Alistipes sp.]